ncbi:MAG: T9SS type A sorting domain-containing protein [Saprospiraceae bacterium]|nr:T9SS type A sorting domain-containing protein [Saprospiraceae bacterium]
MSIDELPTSCEAGGSKEVEDYTVVIEGGSTATLIVNPVQLNFTENGGVQQVGITATVPWSVAKSSADTWINSISPSNGINNGIISVNVAPNQTSLPRSATLTVSGSGLSRSVTITQAARIITPSLTASPQQIEFGEIGGSRTINIQANLAWQVVGLPTWLTASPVSASGNGSLVVTAAPNNTTSARSGSFEIRGNGISAFITVTQNAPLRITCASPTGLEAASVGYAHTVLFWNEVVGATRYQTRYRINGGAWLIGSIYEGTFISWGNRLPCTAYEYQVRAYCGDNQVSDFSPSIFVNTEGCNDIFCYSYGLAWNDWIQRVQFSTLDNDSDFDFGYANFTNLSNTLLRTGQTYPITLTPGKDEESKLVYWRVWIDYNQNGDFGDPGEQVFERLGSNEEAVTGTITIPTQVPQGVTRMRVSMSLGDFSSPCATGNSREVEDYGLVIQTDNIFTVTPTSLNLDAGENNKTLDIITNSSWNASTNRDWINLAAASGVGNQTLNIRIASNPSTNAREGNILINSNNSTINVTVQQEGASSTGTGVGVVPVRHEVTSESGCVESRVNFILSWTAECTTANCDWVDISPDRGSGRATTVKFCYDTNTSTESRTAQIVFSDTRGSSITVGIVQSGMSNAASLVSSPTVQAQDFVLQVYPNPTKETVFAQIFLPQAQTVKLVVADLSGKEISRQVAHLEIGENIVPFEELKPGIYVLQGIAENGTVERQLFVVSE